jgi:hypothetical protein
MVRRRQSGWPVLIIMRNNLPSLSLPTKSFLSLSVTWQGCKLRNTLFMFHILIDTCVWLNLAKDHKQESLLTVISHLVNEGLITIVLPDIVVEEFNSNKERVAKESLQGMKAALRRATEAVHLASPKNKAKGLIRDLNEAGLSIAQLGDQANISMTRIQEIFSDARKVSTSETALQGAAKRAMKKLAPCHRQRNSICDGILFETYLEYKAGKHQAGDRFGFVTHNKADFSDPMDERKPHPDLEPFFSPIKSIYSINLGATLKKIAPSLVTYIMMDAEFEFVPRTLREISSAEEELETKVWYNRHKNRQWSLDNGELTIMPKKGYVNDPKTIRQDIWEGALRSAKKVEKRFGRDNLLWDDFEWGMLNGKLSALRWVIGEDWDSLYT